MIFFKQNSANAFRILNDKCALYTSRDTKFHLLNEIGTKIWKLSRHWVSLEKILDYICREYDVSRRKAKKDTMHFLIRMNKVGLLLKKDEDGTKN